MEMELGSEFELSLPDNVGMGEFLKQADLSHNAVLVHVVLIDLDHHHFTGGVVHDLQYRGGRICPLMVNMTICPLMLNM